MTTYIDSYYAHTLKDGNERPPLRENIETDVCIIGGGLAGMATAMGLGLLGMNSVIARGISDEAIQRFQYTSKD